MGTKHWKLKKSFGLRASWDSERDRREVLRYNREQWQEWKKAHGYSGIPNDEVPGFVNYLRLRASEGANYADIATELGISRTSITNIFEEYDLPRPKGKTTLFRLPNWKRARFIPLDDSQAIEVLLGVKNRNRERRIQERLRREIDLIRRFGQEFGRPPDCDSELPGLLGLAGESSVASYWGKHSGNRDTNRSNREVLDYIYRKAGFRRRGGSGRRRKDGSPVMRRLR